MLIVLYRFMLLSLGAFVVKILLDLGQWDAFTAIMLVACVVPVVWLALAPVLLGFEIIAGELVLHRFLLFRKRETRLPLSEISDFTYSTFKGSKSIGTSVTMYFTTEKKKLTAGRFMAFTGESAHARAREAEALVKPLLTRRSPQQ